MANNTIVYEEDWAVTLQDRLNKPQNWKEICKVEMTDTKVLHNPYLTDITVNTLTRGTAYTATDIVETDETIDINTGRVASVVIDRAELAQSQYTKQMELADNMGTMLNEAIETAMLADHASLTDFGDLGGGSLGLGSGAITVAATNIDDIIRAVKREITKANGATLAQRNGIFFVWRPEDFELLEGFVQASGYSTADNALGNGTTAGMKYMGAYHYVTNSNVSGHAMAGVRGVYHLGICKSTYGKVVRIDEPAGPSGGNISGVGMTSRVDFKFKAWAKTKPVLFDLNVA